MMTNKCMTNSFAATLAGLALAAGGCRNQGQAMKAEAAKAPPALVLAENEASRIID